MTMIRPKDFKCFGEGNAYKLPVVAQAIAADGWLNEKNNVREQIFTDDEFDYIVNRDKYPDEYSEKFAAAESLLVSAANWYSNSRELKGLWSEIRSIIPNYEKLHDTVVNSESLTDAIANATEFVSKDESFDRFAANLFVDSIVPFMYAMYKSKLNSDVVLYSGFRVNQTQHLDTVGTVFDLQVPLCTTPKVETALTFSLFQSGVGAPLPIVDLAMQIDGYDRDVEKFARTTYGGDAGAAQKSLDSVFERDVKQIHNAYSQYRRKGSDASGEQAYTLCFKMKRGDSALPSSIFYRESIYGDLQTIHPYADNYSREAEYTIPPTKFRVTKVDKKNKYIELEPIRDGQ